MEVTSEYARRLTELADRIMDDHAGEILNEHRIHQDFFQAGYDHVEFREALMFLVRIGAAEKTSG